MVTKKKLVTAAFVLVVAGCKDHTDDREELSNPPGPVTSTRATQSAEAARPPAPGETLLWYAAPQSKRAYGGLVAPREREPIGLDVDGDGIEEAIGFVGGGARSSHLFPAIIDATTVKPRWVGPAVTGVASKDSKYPDDSASDADTRGVYIEARKTSILVTTNDGRVVVFDLSGDQVAATSLSARAFGTCVPADDTIRVVQENDVVIDFDVKARAFSPSKEGCPFRPDPRSDCARQRAMPPQLRKPCKERPTWVDFDHGEVSFHATVPDGQVIKDVERGQRTARVGRFTDGDLKRPIWVASVGDDGPIGQPTFQDVFAVDGHEVFVDFERGEVRDRLEWPAGTAKRFLTALDLETGAIRWISATPHGASPASGWLITKARIFVSRHTQLDVFERATGKHLGYVGWR